MKFSKDFKKIKGDASIRKFYRNTKKNSIIVFANIEKIKNLLIYDSINKILIKNNIIAPKLLSQNYRNNYIEIQDLGNKTIYQTFIKNKKDYTQPTRIKTGGSTFKNPIKQTDQKVWELIIK